MEPMPVPVSPGSAGAAERQPKVLVVDDEASIRALLSATLRLTGFEVRVATGGHEALAAAAEYAPDLVVLDVMMPDLDGFEVAQRLRTSGRPVPVLFLTARDSVEDRISGLTVGADDYVAKPFSYPELRARVGALLARANQRRAMGRLRVGDLEVHPSSRRVLLRGTPIELSQKEFALLRTLATEPTKVWTKEELLRSIWGFRSMGTTRTLDSHACRLRHKLAVHGDRFVVNVWGVGYRLVDGPPVAR
jgi:two-component system, OmpR family, response regulator